ncbi:MAG: hypothetical protein LBS50_03030 [Prevotellaceae bacterium]|jgi:hypothetical protein|nr:hypothetical protein [Prevotellaceae bacterium]
MKYFVCSILFFLPLYIFGQPQNENIDALSACPGIHFNSISLSSVKVLELDCNNFSGFIKPTIHVNGGTVTNYTVTSIPYAPPYPFNTGTQIFVNQDDIFSSAITLPFPFCFYENTYNEAIIGANGIISFNTVYAADHCPWMTETYSNIPNGEEMGQQLRNAIYGVMEDIDPRGVDTTGGSIRWALLGEAPCRTLCVSYDRLPLYNISEDYTDPNLWNSYQIVLYEGSNIIDIHVLRRNRYDDWNSGRGLIGVQNADGTKATAAPNRNLADLWEAQTSEAWRFTPVSTPVYTVTYYEGVGFNGPVLGSMDSLQFNTGNLQNTAITARLQFTSCNGTEFDLSDTVLLKWNFPLTEIYETTCKSNYNFNGKILTSSGTFYDTIPLTSGCDSIVALHLQMNIPPATNISAAICKGENYDFNGNSVNITGIYHDTLPDKNNCDSIIILNLTVKPIIIQTENLMICPSALPYSWRDTVFQVGTTAGTFVFNRKSAVSGCDSIVTLKLSINTQILRTESLSVCQENLPYAWRDTIFEVGSNSGTLIFNRFSNSSGCDSIVTLYLTVNQSFAQIENLIICKNNLPYSWRDTVFLTNTTSNTFIFSRKTVYGCDSIVALNLTVNPKIELSESLTICQGDLPYLWQDTVLQIGTTSKTITYKKTLAATGCDSVIILNLTVNPKITRTENVQICPQLLPYSWRDTVFEVGTVTHTAVFNRISNLTGCDSIVTLNFTMLENVSEHIELKICESELPYLWRDTIFEVGTVSKTIIFKKTSEITGCDKITTLILTVNPSIAKFDSLTICENDLPYQWRDVTLPVGSVTGSLLFVYYSEETECDSTVTLALTVIPTIRQTENLTICLMDLPYSWRDTVFEVGTVSVTHLFERTSEITGCDSIVTLNVTVEPLNYFENMTICQNNLPYAWRDTIFEIGTNSNTFIFNKISNAGCDSIVTLNLTVNPKIAQTENLTICQNNLPFVWRDTVFLTNTVSNTFIFNKISNAGCDSIVTLNLTVNPKIAQTENITICENDLPFAWRDTVFEVGTISNAFIFNRKIAATNCDSTVTLHLTVNPKIEQTVNITVCPNGLPFVWRDTVFQVGTTTGTFVFYRQTAATGCDSTVTLNFTVSNSYTIVQIENLAICITELPFVWRDTVFQVGTASNSFSFNRISSLIGCDSIVTLNLTVNPIIEQTENLTICQNDLPFAWRDTVFQTGTTSDTFIFNKKSQITGCDSTATLNLTVIPIIEQSEKLTICQNDLPFAWRDTVFEIGTTSGTFIFTRTSNQTLCDSVVTFNLTVTPIIEKGVSVIICRYALPYHWRDTVFQVGTTTGTFVFHRKSQITGCDSIVTLELIRDDKYKIEQTENLTVCENELPHQWRDIVFPVGTQSGTFMYNTRSTETGCDSIVRLNLTINPIIRKTENLAVCENNFPYQWRDTVFEVGTNAGAFVLKRQSTETGCDSIVTLNLTLTPILFYEYVDTICSKEVYNLNGQILNSAGIYTSTVTSSLNCDSIITLNLAVLPAINALQPDNLPRICADDNSFTLTFLPTNNPSERYPDVYEVVFDGKALAAGFVNQSGEFNGGTEITVNLPDKIYPDNYSCQILLTDFNACPPTPFNIDFDVFYPDSIMQQKWDDVIALLNKYYNGGFEFSAYQWYKNDTILYGQTGSYIYLEKKSLVVGDKYKVLITRADNSQMFSCPFEAHVPKPQISDFPTVVQNGNGVTIYIVKDNAWAKLWTTTGILLQTVKIKAPMHELSLPPIRGAYLLEITPKNQTESRIVVPIVAK